MKFRPRQFRTQADQADAKVATYCYQCVAGPDLLKVNVRNGVAIGIEPNFESAEVHPGGGKVCVKAYGIVQKAYHPNRVLTPMRRTNPKKGRKEDPGFVPISWDEAMETIVAKLMEVREKGLLDESGYPRVAASFGGGGTPQSYMGSFPAFLAAWGPIDFGMGSGQGVKCTHSEHLYGELWHRAFTVSADTPLTRYNVSFGANNEASGGVCGVWRHAAARERGMKRVQIEPALSITGACSAEWVPIKPKTDPAFMYAMIHVLLHEHGVDKLDVPYLKHRTGSPYLIAPNGFFLRDPETRKPLLWDLKRNRAVPADTPDTDPALTGAFTAGGIEIGADEETWNHSGIEVKPAYEHLVAHLADCTPEWASRVCDVPADTIRRVANEYLAHACIGETIEIDGQMLPYRPVAVTLGKTVNNGWGGYECCWARTLLACLVGALEVPGGTLGTTVRLNKPLGNRMASVAPSPDGFLDYPMNPTDRENWHFRPNIRNAYRTLVPLSGDTAWSQALGPTHLAWMFQDKPPKNLPKPTQPDVWFVYRTNPAISAWDAPGMADKIARFPFVVAFAFTLDETNHMADILLPDAVDIESLQLIAIGGTKFIEQFWHYTGYALRQPAITPRGEARDFTDIATELAERCGLSEKYYERINRGGLGVRLSGGKQYDFSLDPGQPHTRDEIWNAVCRAASAELTDGKETEGLDWYREHGLKTVPYSQVNWYLYPRMVELGLRFEMPYQERLFRVGKELANRLHEHDIDWWDFQLTEYQALPAWKDFAGLWEQVAREDSGGQEFQFWLLTSRSMQYSWGNNAALQLIKEVADNVRGHGGVVINAGRAAELGIAEGDLVEVRSSLRATKGRAILRQGIRPDTLLMIGQFDHWKTPYAKDLHYPSMNTITPMSLKLTDATGSSSDVVRVSVKRLGAAA